MSKRDAVHWGYPSACVHPEELLLEQAHCRNQRLHIALRELLCWLQKGKSAEQAGAKCETLAEAIEQAERALGRAE